MLCAITTNRRISSKGLWEVIEVGRKKMIKDTSLSQVKYKYIKLTGKRYLNINQWTLRMDLK